MLLSIIVAAAENNIIGHNNSLIWRLSADLKRFKSLTTGHSVLMGRKTFESIGKPLSNRRNIIITQNKNYIAQGCEIVNDIESALQLVKNEEEIFIIGGETLYREFWNKADKLYLTRVHTSPFGDVSIPEVNLSEWKEIRREDFTADENNKYDYTFIDYCRK